MNEKKNQLPCLMEFREAQSFFENFSKKFLEKSKQILGKVLWPFIKNKCAIANQPHWVGLIKSHPLQSMPNWSIGQLISKQMACECYLISFSTRIDWIPDTELCQRTIYLALCSAENLFVLQIKTRNK